MESSLRKDLLQEKTGRHFGFVNVIVAMKKYMPTTIYLVALNRAGAQERISETKKTAIICHVRQCMSVGKI